MLWIKLFRISNVIISTNIYNIVKKNKTYTHRYQQDVNYWITLSTLSTGILIISEIFPNYKIIRLNYPQINRAVDNLINILWIAIFY